MSACAAHRVMALRAFVLSLLAVVFFMFGEAEAMRTSERTHQGLSQIEHVVVVQFENRAFDHMCGWLRQWGVPVDGLTGREFNIANGTKYFVKDTCPYIHPFDPVHSVDGMTAEIMGVMDDPNAWINPAPMSGYVELHQRKQDPEFWTVMHGFKPDLVPAISTIAKEFAVFDRWYSSLPGPTWPNRLFWLSGTSRGQTSNSILNYLSGMPQRTIIDVLNDHNISWANYYGDVSDTILFRTGRELRNLERLHEYKLFAEHAARGELPAFTWINPKFFPWFDSPANDQHPDHPVNLGDDLIAEVYEILRKSPLWNKTALIIGVDEGGGFYDHVPPPAEHVPNPDGINAADGFNYTRLGVRGCTVVASPLIPRGTVVHEPAEAPFKRYEHSSLYATLREMFNLQEELTNRTAFAAPFDHIFSLTEPRGDCPMTLPVATSPEALLARTETLLQEQHQREPNGLQQFFYGLVEDALGKERLQISEGKHHKTQIDMAQGVRQLMAKLLNQ